MEGRREDVHHEADQSAQSGSTTVFDQIDGDHDAYRDGDRGAYQSLQQGATIAWYAPPPATEAVMPACECVHHAVEVIALIPLATTEYNTHSRGAKAINIASETDTVATVFETRRGNRAWTFAAP